jgi:hypothetical protein
MRDHKKRFFQIGGGCKNVFVARSKDRRGRFTSIWQLIRAGGDQEMQMFLRKAGQKMLWQCKSKTRATSRRQIATHAASIFHQLARPCDKAPLPDMRPCTAMSAF